jgi:TetR/AcrR family hemagglutinin/protease transcriptional regulator
MAPDRRRDQLIECAVRVFARNGIGNAGHALVAEEAGVSTPTVFLYMPNRQALIDSVLREVDNYLSGIVRTAACTRPNATDKLPAIVNTFARTFDNEIDADYVRIFLDRDPMARDNTWPQYMDFQDRML